MCNQKCATVDCDNIVDKTSIWCDKCLDELSDEIEKHPIGFFPTKPKL